MRTQKHIVAFYRPFVGLPVDRQREACRAAAKALKSPIAAEYTAAEHGDDRSDWVKSLKSTDVAVVANLLVIPEPRRPGNRPSSDLAAALFEITGKGTLLVSALDQVSSADGAKWVALVRQAQDSIAMGKRKLSRKKAQAMARKSRENRQPGAVARWLSSAMAKVRAEHGRTWRDPVHENDAAALAAMPDDVQSDIGSLSSARRIFGRRNPRKATKAGRPRNLKPRK